MGSVLNIKKTNKTFSISQKDGKGPDTNFLVQCLSKSVVDGYICYVIFGSLKNLDEIIDSLFTKICIVQLQLTICFCTSLWYNSVCNIILFSNLIVNYVDWKVQWVHYIVQNVRSFDQTL